MSIRKPLVFNGDVDMCMNNAIIAIHIILPSVCCKIPLFGCLKRRNILRARTILYRKMLACTVQRPRSFWLPNMAFIDNFNIRHCISTESHFLSPTSGFS